MEILNGLASPSVQNDGQIEGMECLCGMFLMDKLVSLTYILDHSYAVAASIAYTCYYCNLIVMVVTCS